MSNAEALISKNKITEAINSIKESQKSDETLEVQITLKGYDFKKDKKFDSDYKLPNLKRKSEKVLLISDDSMRDLAKENNIPFLSFSEVQGTSREKKVLKKKTAKYYDSFIVFGAFHKNFELKYFLQKRKPFYILKNKNDLVEFYENVKKTIKFKLRKTPDLSFSTGFVEMEEEKISENIFEGLNFLISLLKKKDKSIKGIVLKSSFSKPTRLF